MINYDKFNSLSDLPISEEMLGAFIEGNLTAEEAALVEHELETSHELMNLFDESSPLIEPEVEIPFEDSIQMDNIDFVSLDPRDDIEFIADIDDVSKVQDNEYGEDIICSEVFTSDNETNNKDNTSYEDSGEFEILGTGYDEGTFQMMSDHDDYLCESEADTVELDSFISNHQ